MATGSSDSDKVNDWPNDCARGEKTVEAVQNTPLAGQGRAKVFDPGSPLDQGRGKITAQSGGGNRSSK